MIGVIVFSREQIPICPQVSKGDDRSRNLRRSCAVMFSVCGVDVHQGVRICRRAMGWHAKCRGHVLDSAKQVSVQLNVHRELINVHT